MYSILTPYIAMHRFCYIIIIFTGVLLLFTSIVLAQHNVDSLLQVLSEEGEESTEYVDQLNKTAYEVRASYPVIMENLARKAVDISNKLNYTKGVAIAYKEIGSSHWMRGNYGKALENYFHSRDLFNELSDSLGIATTSTNIGMVYISQFDTMALDYFKQSKKYYEKTDDQKRLARVLGNIGFHFYNQESYDSALIYFNQSLMIHQKRENDFGIALQHHNIGDTYLTSSDYDVAFGHLQKSIELKKKLSLFSGLASSYNSMGELFRKKGDFDQAVFYYKLGLSFADSVSSKNYMRIINDNLYKVEINRGDFEKAMEYQKVFYNVRIASLEEQKGSEIKQIEITYKLKEKESELSLANQQLQVQSNSKNFLLAIITLLVISGVIIYLGQTSRFRKARQLQQAKENLNTAELENGKLREQELKNQLEFRNKELTSFTINFIQKNELLEELKALSENLLKISHNLNEDQKADLNRISRTISLNLNREKDWEDFKLYFENVHKDFFIILKNRFSDLTGTDLKISAMIRLNLNMKETANIMGISLESIKKSRYRLRKKFNLEHEENLFDFLMEIEKSADVIV